jgi:DNA-binding NarL/FixJ family response regulator
VRWFRGPLGRELCRLTGRSHGDGVIDKAMGVPAAAHLGEDDTRLLWLLIEGKTNREIAFDPDVSEDVVARRLVEMYATIGVSSRGEAAVLAFRESMV